MKNYWVVGVAGGSASGKTTIVNKIAEHFGTDILVINHDNYYKRQDEISLEERKKMNYDHPSAFDTDRLIQDLDLLLSGQNANIPVYDFVEYNRTDKVTVVSPKKIIVIDGFLVLDHEELRKRMDIKVFVDTDSDERLIRRIKRDMVERGRTVESVLKQYAETVKPMHEEFVEPSKRYADVIIPRGGENIAGISMLISYMDQILKQ